MSTSGIMRLPPIGRIGEDGHADAAGYINSLREEAVMGRDGWVEIGDKSMTIYAYGSDPAPDDETLVVPDIQNTVQATTDIQTKEKPSIVFEPVESGDPPLCFWTGPQDLGILPPQSGGLGLATNLVADWRDEAGQTQPPLPLSEEQADQIHDLIAAGGMPVPDGAGGMKLRKMKPDWLVEVNVQFVAEFYQGLFDVYWRRSGFDESVRANLLATNIQGWQLWPYEFDADEQRHVWREMSIRQMYIDPTVRDIRFAAYAGMDVVLDRDEAKKLYPNIAEFIEEGSQVGIPTRADSNVTFGQAVDRDFRRPVVTMAVFWLRNQECPMRPQDALERGKIEVRQVPDEAAIAAMPPVDESAGEQDGEGTASGLDEMTGDDWSENEPESDDGGDDSGEAGDDENGALDNAGTDDRGAGDPESGEGLSESAGSDDDAGAAEEPGEQAGVPGLPVEPQPIPTRAGIFLPGGDEEIHTAHPAWPTYRCIRQITLIGSTVVEDKESDFFDIPITHNVNRPIPGRPFGQGEPYVLWKLQNAKSRVLQSMVDHVEYFGHPASSMSESMAASMEDRYDDVHVIAGRTVIVEDELYKQEGGQIHTLIAPPAMSDGLMKIYPILSREIDDIGGYTEALQGQASPDVKSGRMLDSMQSAGASIMGFKAARTADMLERLGNECLHSLVNRLDADDVLRVNRKYPRHIVEAIIKIAREIEWNVSVTIASGNGTVKRQKKADAREDFKLGATSLKTYQEAAGIDSRQEDQRMQVEAEKRAKAMQQQAMAQPQPAGPPAQ